MFTDEAINESCFMDKLVEFANGDYNVSAFECRSEFMSLVGYLESNTIVQCSTCGYFFNYNDEGIYDGENYYCDDCSSDNNNYIRTYHDYHIVNNSQTVDTFGIELEVEFPSSESAEECSKEVHDTLGDTFIMAEDGSLCNGVEFISHVWDMKDINAFYLELETLTGIIEKYGGVCHDSSNSGLHVHIGLKEGCHVNRLENFMYENKHLFSCLSGRLPVVGTFEYARPYDNGRYSFINETSMTVEFRLWNSTLEPMTIVERIALSYYLYNFTSNDYSDGYLKELDFYRLLKSDNYFREHGVPLNLLAYCHKWLNKRFEDILPYI